MPGGTSLRDCYMKYRDPATTDPDIRIRLHSLGAYPEGRLLLMRTPD